MLMRRPGGSWHAAGSVRRGRTELTPHARSASSGPSLVGIQRSPRPPSTYLHPVGQTPHAQASVFRLLAWPGRCHDIGSHQPASLGQGRAGQGRAGQGTRSCSLCLVASDKESRTGFSGEPDPGQVSFQRVTFIQGMASRDTINRVANHVETKALDAARLPGCLADRDRPIGGLAAAQPSGDDVYEIPSTRTDMLRSGSAQRDMVLMSVCVLQRRGPWPSPSQQCATSRCYSIRRRWKEFGHDSGLRTQGFPQ